ncbi:uncharacterized protein LOC114351364 [Ostrinia furnacalis]|uniref:uncharacterized protein LOC114351364 n=1 Tax=Ostrinia furnacalis TaxID=93504 RepID=UPI001040B787|nr:uncharacterized protein LOC114351364 [Ostrinia furnacalis]
MRSEECVCKEPIESLHLLHLDKIESRKEDGFFTALEDKLESKLGEYANVLSGWLGKFNDEHLGNSELGRYLHYNEIKPKIEETGMQGRGMKKLSMALLPVIFHVGATSTWMLITTLLAAKSVAIGLALLVFKIAVSSAKVASFFTLLKAKHHHEWTPHYEHHGHKRSLSDLEHIPTYVEHPTSHDDWSSYTPQWTPSEPHKTIASYKHAADPYTEYAESKKVEKVYGKN